MGKKFRISGLLLSLMAFMALGLFNACEPGEALDVVKPEDTEPPVISDDAPPFIGFVDWPAAIVVDTTQTVKVVVMDSAKTSVLPNLTIRVTSKDPTFGTITDTSGTDTSLFTTSSLGTILFDVVTKSEGSLLIEVNALDAAGNIVVTQSKIINVVPDGYVEEITKKLTLDVMNPILNADGESKSNLKVTVKDEFNHPIVGTEVLFGATGGTIMALATTDEEGVAMGWIKSERRNTTVFITATIEYLGETTTETRNIVFDSLSITVKPRFAEIGVDQRDTVSFQLKDAAGVPITNDTMLITLSKGYTFEDGDKDTLKGVTDGYGKVTTWVTTSTYGTMTFSASALGTTGTGTIKVVDNDLANVAQPKTEYIDWPEEITLDTAVELSLKIIDSTNNAPIEGLSVSLGTKGQNLGIFQNTDGDDTTQFSTTAEGKINFQFTPTRGGQVYIEVTVLNSAGEALYTDEKLLDVVEKTETITSNKLLNLRILDPVINADGSSKARLHVTVKDEENHPLVGVLVKFDATGGIIVDSAESNEEGIAEGWIKSERRNMIVYVTATVTSGEDIITETQSVVFSGIKLTISPQTPVSEVKQRDSVTITLQDAGGLNMANDTMLLVISGDVHFENTDKDSLIAVTNATGQYTTWISSERATTAVIDVFAMGTTNRASILFTTNTLSLKSDSSFITGNGTSTSLITATLKDGDGKAISGALLKWNTSFGTFQADKPLTTTDGSGESNITLKSPSGSGIALISAEARDADGALIASDVFTFEIKPMIPHNLNLTITPDNIRVKVGEAVLTAEAFDEHGDIINDLLIGFMIVKTAGGGDDIIEVPTAYTKEGKAKSIFKAGGVVSQYLGVKITAIALHVHESDTIVLASSDTVGLTISGPPAFVTVGTNLEKLINNEDGLYHLPLAAVVTDINGNKVTDGTPVNFSLVPSAYYPNYAASKQWYGETNKHGESVYFGYVETIDPPFYIVTRTPYYVPPLHWTDYNNNEKLDKDEEPNTWGRPYRGEDRDGNGYINEPPEVFVDINGDGIWQSGDPADPKTWAEPAYPIHDSSYPAHVDYNGNGHWDKQEPFTDLNNDSTCNCVGTYDSSGALYEFNYEGGDLYKDPLPYGKGGGIKAVVETEDGAATQEITYPQTEALHYHVIIWAESNGIRGRTDRRLPIDEGVLAE
ncbi:MAG: Ig-like domain-containing protein [Fibrobacteria bacterium]|nr:Ig-like domain-containing protein [Fibrobacteria bacterium]